MRVGLVGSEMCIRDSVRTLLTGGERSMPAMSRQRMMLAVSVNRNAASDMVPARTLSKFFSSAAFLQNKIRIVLHQNIAEPLI